MKKIVTRTLLVLFALLGVLQFVQPERTNPPVQANQTLQATTQMPAEVSTILDRSCNDCHSSQTRWPWYSHFAPASWLVVHDVNEGRAELSFSEWGSYPAKKAEHKLEEICEQVEKDHMPIKPYLLLHSEARLSPADKQTLCNWTRQERARLAAAEK